MTPKPRGPRTKDECLHVRLTTEEQERVERRAEANGLTVSEWVRKTTLEALESSPGERRLMSFIAAQTIAIRLSLEELQAGKDLAQPDVQERIQRLALRASREYMDAARASATQNGEAA